MKHHDFQIESLVDQQQKRLLTMLMHLNHLLLSPLRKVNSLKRAGIIKCFPI